MALGLGFPPAVASFLSREARGRPSDLDPMAEGDATVSGPNLAQEGAVLGWFGGLAIGCWAEGPSAARAEWSGLISRPGCFNSESFNCFFYFSEAFSIDFV